MPLDFTSPIADYKDSEAGIAAPALPKPDAALAFALAESATYGPSLLFVDASGARIEQLGRLAAAFQPELEVLVLPAWDALPYDRISPSPALIGQRVHALARLAEAPDTRRLVLRRAPEMGFLVSVDLSGSQPGLAFGFLSRENPLHRLSIVE